MSNHDKKRRARALGTWAKNASYHFVSIDFRHCEDIQNFVETLFKKKRLTKKEIDALFEHEWTPQRYNLLSIVLQTLFHEHPDVQEILRRLQSLGCIEWATHRH